MTTPRKTAAKAVPTKKPVAPVVAVKSEAEGATRYRVTGRVLHNGVTLRPADPATGREADTVELTEQEAYGLRGFIEPAPATDTATPTE